MTSDSMRSLNVYWNNVFKFKIEILMGTKSFDRISQ